MPNIYDEIFEIEQLLETIYDLETGEINEEKERELLVKRDALINLGLENLCNARGNKVAYINALKEEEERLYNRRKAEEKHLERLNNSILFLHNKNGHSVSIAGTWKISTRKSTQVNVIDPTWYDARFFKTETVEKLDKMALKEALKTEEIKGVELKTNINLVVK
jgi:5'(3')-deoxyribonucleotidase